MSARLRAVSAAAACVVALLLTACGRSGTRAPAGESVSSQTSRTLGTARTVVSFSTHAGLAFGAFKLFILDPYEQGTLAVSHPLSVVKAGAAGVFAFHELREASADVRANRHLARLAGPFTALGATLSLIRHEIDHGDTTAAITTIKGQVATVTKQAASLGNPIPTITSGIKL